MTAIIFLSHIFLSLRFLLPIYKLIQVKERLTKLRQAIRRALHKRDGLRSFKLARCATQRELIAAFNLLGHVRTGFLAQAFGEFLRLKQHEVIVHQQQGLRRDGRAVAAFARIHQIRLIEGLKQRIANAAFGIHIQAAPPRRRIIVRLARPRALRAGLK